jgi:hypothetical protein
MNYHALLAHFPKITYTRYKKLFNFFSTPQAIWEAEFSDLTKTGIEETIVDEFIQWKEKIDTQTILKKLEEAYLTLSNIEKRVEYDKSLSRKGYSENVDFQAEGSPVVSFMSGNPWKEEETKPESEKRELKLVATAEMMKIETEVISGEELKKIRENRGLSIEDVARITKIPTRFVINLEADLFKELPARVYVQGFIKNMAGLYRVEMNTLVKAYLKHWDQSSTKTSV